MGSTSIGYSSSNLGHISFISYLFFIFCCILNVLNDVLQGVWNTFSLRGTEFYFERQLNYWQMSFILLSLLQLFVIVIKFPGLI